MVPDPSVPLLFTCAKWKPFSNGKVEMWLFSIQDKIMHRKE